MKEPMNYKRLTFLLAVLFVLTLIFYTIPNYQNYKLDKFCEDEGLDYAKEDRTTFTCCSMFEISDWENQQTNKKEGCVGEYDLGVFG